MARILVADRDRLFRTVVRRMLEAEGHQIFVATDLHSALLALEVRDVELLLVEGHIATREDCRLIRWCQKGKMRIPILLLSSRGWLEGWSVLETGPQSHYVGFLEKPFGWSELYGMVAQALEG